MTHLSIYTCKSPAYFLKTYEGGQSRNETYYTQGVSRNERETDIDGFRVYLLIYLISEVNV